MRIAVLGDCVLPTPYQYGHGLGRMVSLISEHLHLRGHDVTLYAREGSQFSGRLVMPPKADGYAGEWILAQAALRDHRQQPFDVFYDNGHLHCVAEMFPDMPVINEFHDAFQPYARCPILKSSGQRAFMPPEFEGARVIPNALNPAEYPFNIEPNPDAYVLFMGALADIKQPMLAIEACARMGVKLVMAGAPLTGQLPISENSNTTYVGAIYGRIKVNLLQGARVFLQLGLYESFGLTTLEANLCGVPVVGWPAGGTLDQIRYGVNGVLVIPGGDKVQAVCDAIERAWNMDRVGVRQYVENRYSLDKQVNAIEDALSDCVLGKWW